MMLKIALMVTVKDLCAVSTLLRVGLGAGDGIDDQKAIGFAPEPLSVYQMNQSAVVLKIALMVMMKDLCAVSTLWWVRLGARDGIDDQKAIWCAPEPLSVLTDDSVYDGGENCPGGDDEGPYCSKWW